MRIRLHGTEQECREAVSRIEQQFSVVSVSEPYPDRGASVLVRVDIETRPQADTPD
jgi:hypothetical protein